MTKETALTTTRLELQVSDAEVAAVLYDPTVLPVEKAPLFTEAFLKAASRQLEQETTETSPWFTKDDDDPETVVQKEGMLLFEIATRALEIAKNWKQCLSVATFQITAEIQRQRLHYFPSDGTYRTLEEIVKETLPENDSKAAGAVAAFVENQLPLLEELGVSAADMASIADEKLYMYGRMYHQINKVIKDEDATQEEKNERIKQIAKDGKELSIGAFDDKYSNQSGAIPPIRMNKQESGGGRALVLLEFDTEAQERVFERRLKGMLAYDDANLLRPVSPQQVFELMTIPDLTDEAYESIAKMLKATVLGDRVCYAVYGVLTNDQHRGKLIDFDTVNSILVEWSPDAIKLALADLAYYGLIEVQEIATKTLYKAR